MEDYLGWWTGAHYGDGRHGRVRGVADNIRLGYGGGSGFGYGVGFGHGPDGCGYGYGRNWGAYGPQRYRARRLL